MNVCLSVFDPLNHNLNMLCLFTYPPLIQSFKQETRKKSAKEILNLVSHSTLLLNRDDSKVGHPPKILGRGDVPHNFLGGDVPLYPPPLALTNNK